MNSGPKGEFETTQEYRERAERAAALRAQLKEKHDRARAEKRTALENRLSELLDGDYAGAVEPALGTYDADAQRFPVMVTAYGYRTSLFVPRDEARRLKESFSEAEREAIFGLYLDGAGAEEYILRLRVRLGEKTYLSDGLAADDETALRILYNDFDEQRRRAAWSPENIAPELLEGSGFGDEDIFAATHFVRPYSEGGIEKRFILTKSKPEEYECHACAPLLGGVVFARRNNAWRVEAASSAFGRYGSWGKPPDAELVKIGPDKTAVQLSWGYMGQGVTMEGGDYIAQVNRTLKEVLAINTAGDNSAAIGVGRSLADYEVFSSRVTYLPRPDSEYFDVKLLITGRRGTKVGRRFVVRPFSEVKLYRFLNDAFTQVP